MSAEHQTNTKVCLGAAPDLKMDSCQLIDLSNISSTYWVLSAALVAYHTARGGGAGKMSKRENTHMPLHTEGRGTGVLVFLSTKQIY